MQTQYDKYRSELDQDQVCQDLIIDGELIALGVSAPYAGCPTPCVEQIFNAKDAPFFFTDSLTGCAGFIAISGNQTENAFEAHHILIIHDKGGDELQSTRKLLELFVNDQTRTGSNSIKLVWGNGRIPKDVDQTHSEHTKSMVRQLEQKYSHLSTKNISQQMILAVTNNGTPLIGNSTGIDKMYPPYLTTQTSQKDNKKHQYDHVGRPGSYMPRSPGENTTLYESDKKTIDRYLIVGQCPDINLTLSNEKLKAYLHEKMCTIPTQGHDAVIYSELITRISIHTNPTLKKIGSQLQQYRFEFIKSSLLGQKQDSKLISQNWWILLMIATELIKGFDEKNARQEIFSNTLHTKMLAQGLMHRNLLKEAQKEFESLKCSIDSRDTDDKHKAMRVKQAIPQSHIVSTIIFGLIGATIAAVLLATGLLAPIGFSLLGLSIYATSLLVGTSTGLFCGSRLGILRGVIIEKIKPPLPLSHDEKKIDVLSGQKPNSYSVMQNYNLLTCTVKIDDRKKPSSPGVSDIKQLNIDDTSVDEDNRVLKITGF